MYCLSIILFLLANLAVDAQLTLQIIHLSVRKFLDNGLLFLDLLGLLMLGSKAFERFLGVSAAICHIRHVNQFTIWHLSSHAFGHLRISTRVFLTLHSLWFSCLSDIFHRCKWISLRRPSLVELLDLLPCFRSQCFDLLSIYREQLPKWLAWLISYTRRTTLSTLFVCFSVGLHIPFWTLADLHFRLIKIIIPLTSRLSPGIWLARVRYIARSLLN